MIIKIFGQFVLRGRREAVFLALLFTFLPLFHWMAGVIIALLTLRKGIYEGFIVLLWTALPYVVLAVLKTRLPLVDGVLCGYFPVWLFASLLRYVNESRLIEIAIGLAGLVIIGIHGFIPHLQDWWVIQITHSVQLLVGKISWVQLHGDQVKKAVSLIAPYATGFQVAIILLVNGINIIIAQYIEGVVLNVQNALKSKWLQIRLSIGMVVWFIINLLLITIVHWAVFKDIVPVVVLGFFVAGLSLAQVYLNRIKSIWTGLFYGAVIVTALFIPELLIIVLIIAMVDSIFNIRKYMLVK